MADRHIFKDLYELQSGGLPLEQVLVIETVDNGQKVPTVCASFADAEMDVFIVEYGPEDEIILHAEDVTHITTAAFQLQQIMDFFAEAQSLNAEISKTMTDDGCQRRRNNRPAGRSKSRPVGAAPWGVMPSNSKHVPRRIGR